ncbi:hypothetical protein PWT90_08854 [Aphanocladium album]|nr:hypothetical protein PWT90_08854 [Aphanocladium album]
MTSQPSDAFLPSGGFDSDVLLAASPPSQAEPSTSSSAAAAAAAAYDLQPIYEYHSMHSAAGAAAAAPRFAPSAPHFTYASAYLPLASSLNASTRRESNLSPTDIGIARAPRPPMPPPAASSLQHDAPSPSLAVATSLSRSASADAAAPQQTSLHLVQRLAQQNSLIRDAWEAERKYLEANRKRAEEVYQEERTIMEDMRESWLNEKAAMQRELHALRDCVQRLETENAGLRSVTSPASQLSGLVSPAVGAKLHANSLPPGLEGASRRPHFVSSNGLRTSPTGSSDPSAHTPLDPRTQPETSSARDFLASRKKTGAVPIPLIDVHEIDPKLDGIFIKANAVRDTFTQSSVKSSPATSPPTDHSSSEQEGTLQRRTSSKAQTMQALAAGEIRRRTMHAGHTPNHSLSLFPTMTTLDGSMTAGQSEATTPTAVNKAPMEDEEEPELVPEPEPEHVEEVAETDKLPESPVDDVEETQMEPRLEPKDDVALKGPLMVKNIPAQDEIFWAQVNQKLEGISNSEEEALPTVMKAQLTEDEKPKTNGGLEVPEETKPLEADVPLKIRTTTNFGAPFGVA